MKITLPEEKDEQKAPGSNVNEDMLEASFLTRKEKRRYRRKQEKEKLAGMTGKQKISYYLEYNLWKTLGILLAVFIVVMLGVTIYRNSRPFLLRIAILNNDPDIKYDSFEAEYREFYPEGKDERFQVDGSYKIDFENAEDEFRSSPSSATSYDKLVAYTKSDYYDAIITDRAGYDYVTLTDMAYNMNLILSEDTLKRLSGQILYITLQSGETVPIGLDLKNASGLPELSYEEAMLCFPCAAEKNKASAERLVRYLFE